ncbi:OmpA family protein [Larkinella soli]|uniref:OmpA family protein n=1 Tax=Larkinella soli TaxID=1770527 RepID=UPI000FFC3864|nr:OmpA family protein [Larkinella soli]
MLRLYVSWCLLFWLFGSVRAQSVLRQADHEFDNLAYAQAVELYEQVLNRTILSEEAQRPILKKLAFSYRQLHDSRNAERVYEKLIRGLKEPTTDFLPCYLYYAQALAGNGKYRDAQEIYRLYDRYRPEDPRGKHFSNLYSDLSVLTRDAGNYRIEFLGINTNRAEFSPTYYRDGLVFVTNRRQGNALKRVFQWDHTAFLDLYYLPEPPVLKDPVASLSGEAATRRKTAGRTPRRLGEDENTGPTANDSPTVGFRPDLSGPLPESSGTDIGPTRRFSPALNTKYHEGPAAFTKDGSWVFFTRNNYFRGRYGVSAEGVNKLKIYSAENRRGAWLNLQELPFNSDAYSTGHPALSPNDRLLYFASDRPGGFGGTDLYVSRLVDGKWTDPVNLGSSINSVGNELFPFVDDRGNLYFSSDGHPGLGGLDLFYAQLTEGTGVRSVRNLGEPFNSSQDDFGMLTDGGRIHGFFCSNRSQGGNDDDIYRFQRVSPLYPCRELTVRVVDAESGKPLVNARVEVEQKEVPDQKNTRQTDKEGNVRLCLDPESDFRFDTFLEGYQPGRVRFSTKGLSDDLPLLLEIPMHVPLKKKARIQGRILSQTGRLPLDSVRVVIRSECDSTVLETFTGADGTYAFFVDPGCHYFVEAFRDCMGTAGAGVRAGSDTAADVTMFTEGDILRIENIHYDLNRWMIRADAAAELDKLAALMKRYPTMKIELRSHTDSRAPAGYNQVLSERRAGSAAAYLRKKGISAGRVTAKGYGESNPLNSCRDGVPCSEAAHQYNRRTEIKILRVD